ncbi:hypothetical protein [Kitasatospora paranensis]|uniref:Uncharacterized protein n=1 Tax=Kitasatospora paranensis TaxID=258053 RepID=A0ABW2G378_9ACTN
MNGELYDMAWTAWDIPGWHDDPDLRNFYKHSLHPEMIADIALCRPAAVDGSDHARRLRESLEYLLAERPADVGSWWSLTRFTFLTEENLYGYLRELHSYFYGDRADPPPAPEY